MNFSLLYCSFIYSFILTDHFILIRVTHCTHHTPPRTQTFPHTHSHTCREMDHNQSVGMYQVSRRKPENPEETRRHTERACKTPHTHELYIKASRYRVTAVFLFVFVSFDLWLELLEESMPKIVYNSSHHHFYSRCNICNDKMSQGWFCSPLPYELRLDRGFVRRGFVWFVCLFLLRFVRVKRHPRAVRG